jgi:hypothetical protein
MAEPDKGKTNGRENDTLPNSTTSPLVFISHDSRDADLAEAFSKLLKSVSAGMLKCFRSSDKKGNEGFQFGDEWYSRLMDKLQAASEVVCLFTQRSIDRPWILYEAGIAKARTDMRVRAIVFGVPLARLQTGPFFHFQNLESTEESLSKLVLELAGRVPGLEPDADVIKTQVKAFKVASDKIIEGLANKDESEAKPEENPMAKFLEEMKVLVRDLPSRVSERMNEASSHDRRRRTPRIHPRMLHEIMSMSGDSGDPISIMLIASMVRDDMPWFYEIAQETYRALNAGEMETAKRQIKRLHQMRDLLMHGPFMEEYGGKNMEMFMMELPHMFEHLVRRCLEDKKPIKTLQRKTKALS